MFKKMSVVCAILFAVVFLPMVASATLDTAWTRKYNGTGDSTDASTAMALDDLGNVYVAGYSCAETTGADFILIKYDQSGNEEWLVRYNTPENLDEYVNGMAMDNAGNIYLTGTAKKASELIKGDFLTVKINALGKVEWANRFNGKGNGDDFAWSIAVDQTGNVYVGGTSKDAFFGNDFGVIKYSASGKQEWAKTYNGPASRDEELYAIALDNKGNVYACGSSYGAVTYEDFVTVKYNGSGKQLWAQRYIGETPGADQAKAIAVDKTGSVYVTGVSAYDFLTIKYNSAGKELWNKRYSMPDLMYNAQLIGVDDSGNVCVAGNCHGADMLDDWQVVKYDSEGNELWHYVYDGYEEGDDLPKAMALDQDGNPCVTGGTYTKSYGPNFVTIKFRRESGTPSEYIEYKGYYFDEPKAIAVDKQGNIYVTGVSEGIWTGKDMLTIKYIPR